MGKATPIGPDTPDRIILGAGALYRGYGNEASTTAWVVGAATAGEEVVLNGLYWRAEADIDAG